MCSQHLVVYGRAPARCITLLIHFHAYTANDRKAGESQAKVAASMDEKKKNRARLINALSHLVFVLFRFWRAASAGTLIT